MDVLTKEIAGRTLPPIDLEAPDRVLTATFALG